MTPAESPNAAANVLRLASFTSAGTKTTAAPSPVAAPAPMTNPKAIPRLGLSVGMVNAQTGSIVSPQWAPLEDLSCVDTCECALTWDPKGILTSRESGMYI